MSQKKLDQFFGRAATVDESSSTSEQHEESEEENADSDVVDVECIIDDGSKETDSKQDDPGPSQPKKVGDILH